MIPHSDPRKAPRRANIFLFFIKKCHLDLNRVQILLVLVSRY